MSKDSKRIPERGKTRNYRWIIADASQILRQGSPMHLRLKISANVGDCPANIPRLVTDHCQIFAEHFSRQNIANGSRKISMQALKILGIGKCSPTSTTRLFAEGSVIPPEHRLMLVNFHRECIGDAKKAQWDIAISNNHQAEGRYLMVQWSKAPHGTLWSRSYGFKSWSGRTQNAIHLSIIFLIIC